MKPKQSGDHRHLDGRQSGEVQNAVTFVSTSARQYGRARDRLNMQKGNCRPVVTRVTASQVVAHNCESHRRRCA